MNATLECEAADDFPLIRIATFTQNQPWNVTSKATACTGTGFAPFSAVCYYFGKNLYQALNSGSESQAIVPIGLMSSNVGGTAVERWSGPDATAQCNQTGVVEQVEMCHALFTSHLRLFYYLRGLHCSTGKFVESIHRSLAPDGYARLDMVDPSPSSYFDEAGRIVTTAH